MLASSAPIVFPAFLLFDNDDYYHDLTSMDALVIHRDPQNTWGVGGEVIDSAGQRFLIHAVVNTQEVPSDPPRPRWKRWLGVKGHPLYRFEYELEALAPEDFEETFRRLSEKDAGQEAYHVMEGGAPDRPEDRARFNRCRSIADIIEYHNTPPPGSPRSVTESIVWDLRDWWRGLWRR